MSHPLSHNVSVMEAGEFGHKIKQLRIFLEVWSLKEVLSGVISQVSNYIEPDQNKILLLMN